MATTTTENSAPNTGIDQRRRASLGQQIHAVGSKISHALHRDAAEHREGNMDSTVTGLVQSERSVSRGREYISSGRGGAGNIHVKSLSPQRPADGPDDFSDTRGRELPAGTTVHDQKVFSTGRGGAGNMRSPSHDATARSPDAEERRVIRDHSRDVKDAPVSTGRGGLGNIQRSHSRPAGESERHHDEKPHGSHNILGNFLSKHSHDEPRPSESTT